MTRYVEHRGCRLKYRLEGDGGPPVMFIQGVGVAGGGWALQVQDLASAFRCLSYDNRGIGESQPVGTALTVGQMAEDALAVMDAAGWDSAHIVGHSLGGLIAIRAALTARQRVRSLALMCTFADGRAVAPLTRRMVWLGLRTILGTRGMRRRAFLRLVMPGALVDQDPDGLADRLGKLFGHDLADQPPVVKQQLAAMRGEDLTTRLSELAGLRTLILSGTHDPIAPPHLGNAIAAGIPDARHVEFSDASHALPIQLASQVNAMLTEHLLAAELPAGVGHG